jgi:cell division protein FtsN
MGRDFQFDRKRKSHPLVTGVFIGLLVGLCLALAVALYLSKMPSPFVARDKPAEPDKSAAAKTVPKLEAVKPEPAPGAQTGKGAEPKTRLDFYTILPGKEEVVPDKEVSQSQSAPGAGTARVVYYLQAGAFQNPADADNLKARLALAGLEAQIQTATVPDKGVWHRVRMGPYSNAQDLEKARAALRENKIESAVIKVSEPLAKR